MNSLSLTPDFHCTGHRLCLLCLLLLRQEQEHPHGVTRIYPHTLTPILHQKDLPTQLIKRLSTQDHLILHGRHTTHGSSHHHSNTQGTLGTLPRGRLGPKNHITDSTQVVVDFLVTFRKPHLRDAPNRCDNHIREDGPR